MDITPPKSATGFPDPFESSQALVRHLDATYPRLPSQYEAVSPTGRRAAAAHIWLVSNSVAEEVATGSTQGTVLVMLDQSAAGESHGGDIVSAATGFAMGGVGGWEEDLRVQVVELQRYKAEAESQIKVLRQQVAAGKQSRSVAEAAEWRERVQRLEVLLSSLRTERDDALAQKEAAEEVETKVAQQNAELQRRLWELEQRLASPSTFTVAQHGR